MVEPFHSASPSRSGMLARLRRRRPARKVERELWQLLGEASRLRDVSVEQIDWICARSGAGLFRDLAPLRSALYRRFLEHCLLDCALSPEERAELGHLRLLLGLSEQEAAEVHDGVAKAVYGDALDQVLEDHRCDPEEEHFLAGLREDLRLADEVAVRLREEAVRRARDRFVSGAAVHDSLYVTSRHAVIELEGESAESLEDAIRDALVRACETLEGLAEAQLAEARVLLEAGEVKEWRVKMRAMLSREEENRGSETETRG